MGDPCLSCSLSLQVIGAQSVSPEGILLVAGDRAWLAMKVRFPPEPLARSAFTGPGYATRAGKLFPPHPLFNISNPTIHHNQQFSQAEEGSTRTGDVLLLAIQDARFLQ